MRSEKSPTATLPCSVDGCEQPVLVKKRGLCRSHYNRWQRHGDPLGGKFPRGISAAARFSLCVSIDPISDCWLWGGSQLAPPPRDYGLLWNGRTQVLAHRWSYEWHVGPIPDGADLDHLCRTPRCVNPEHLEPVPHKVNLERGEGAGAKNTAKTRCPRGHEYDSVVKAKYGTQRMCKTCRNESGRRTYHERKARQ